MGFWSVARVTNMDFYKKKGQAASTFRDTWSFSALRYGKISKWVTFRQFCRNKYAGFSKKNNQYPVFGRKGYAGFVCSRQKT
ncbi:hypothetical protein CE91St49_21960 [Emergencia timonensis]|nr:hypothetical protein CE91St48_22020 [Emergencia timonensis]BDF12849.1 hypothetical protein CE91St49_21960 [Emergencia timonensis]